MERRRLLATFHVSSTADDGTVGTLRWAIQQVNQDQALDTIDFTLTGSGIHTIRLGSLLPALTSPVLIDGTTQASPSGSPLVELDGSMLPSGSNGLTLSAGFSTIQGLAINGFSGAGIVLTSGDQNVLIDNVLGTDTTGQIAKPNGIGILISGSSRNTIGGDSGTAGNLISGNLGNGIAIYGNTLSSENVIQGNLIGTDSTGRRALPNRQNGIYLDHSSNNLIGGALPSSSNLISGNGASGILIKVDFGESAANVITGNRIGLTKTVNSVLGNIADGIALFGATGTTIGGSLPGSSNIVSGNQGQGIRLAAGTTLTVIVGNFIGTDGSGTIPLGNQLNGIILDQAPQNTIGGTTLAAMNVISANQSNGIDAETGANSLLIQGNAIGTDPSGLINLGNASNGIFLVSSQNLIGGTDFGAGNLIAFNGTGSLGAGIQLMPSAGRNSFLSNSIFGNHRLGINLGNGPTPNDLKDGDIGGNGLQNYPVLTSAQVDGLTTSVQGTLNSTPGTKFLLQFFSSPAIDGTGYGPGKFLVGTLTVTTDQDGNATFSTSGFDPAKGGFLSATATAPDGSTSEFSQSISIQTVADLSISVTSSADVVHAGSTVTYTITVTNRSALAAQSVLVRDTLTGSLAIQSINVSQGTPPSLVGNMVSANFGTLAGGATASITIVVQPLSGSLGTITSSATVSSLSPDSNPSNNNDSVTTTVRPAADLNVSISTDAPSVQIESNSTFTISVKNQGPSTAHNVILKLPSILSARLISISAANPIPGSDGTISVNLGDLAAGTSIDVKLVVQALSMSGLTVNATVSSDDDDLNIVNNTSSATKSVTAATDLSVSIATDRESGYRGLNLVYTITVQNKGPCDASGVVLTQALPAGARVISVSSDLTASPTINLGILTGQIGNLMAGAGVTFRVIVQPNLDSPNALSTSAMVSSGVAELDTTNNSADLQTLIANASDLSIVTTSGPSTAEVGQVVTYVITVTNHGPSDDPDVRFLAMLPPGLSFVSALASQGSLPTYAQGKLTADLGALASGQSTTLRIMVIPTLGKPGGLTTTASVQGTNADLDSSDNSTAINLNVAPVELVTQLAVSQDRVETGNYFTVTATVANSGTARATGVILSLPFDSRVQVVSASSTRGTTAIHGNVVTTSLGSLDVGDVATISFRLLAISAGVMTNIATVSADEFNVDPGQGIASVTSVIQESPGVIQFASPTGQVAVGVGYATIPVTRTWGSSGTITVRYQTEAGSAIAGRDYLSTSGVLTFLPGQTWQSIQIPVLATPHADSNYTLNVILTDPSSGALLGSQRASVLTIHDPNPDTTAPRIVDMSLSGAGKSITGLTFTFSETIGVDAATNPQSFRLVSLGPDGRFGTPDDQPVGFGIPIYDANQHTITINPDTPLSPNKYYAIQIVASGMNALRDLAGNPLDGTGMGFAGITYVALFARGTNLNYKDSLGNSVNLRLLGPGFLDQIRNADGDGQSLVLQNVVQGRSTLTGSVKRGRTRFGSTQLGTIDGLGSFGQIHVKLSSSAFRVQAYPFSQSSRHQPLVSQKLAPKIKHVKPKALVRQSKSLHHR